MKPEGSRGAVSKVLRLALPLLVFSLWSVGELWAERKTTDQVIQLYQSRAARDPRDRVSYSKLGAAYIEKARATGDIRYYDLAEKALRQALEGSPDSSATAAALTGLASVSVGRHQFRDAVGYAEKAFGYAASSGAYAVVGDAYVEMGEYDKAWTAYEKMLAMPGPPPESRVWYLRFLRGDPRAAIEEMQRVVRGRVQGDATRERAALRQAELADLLFQTGDLERSETFYRDSLTSYPGYHLALSGLARVRAAQRRYDEAAKLYQQALAVIPLPEYAAGLGDVYTKMGRPQEAKKHYALVEYIGALNTIPHTKAIYNRELALFYADHGLKLKETLELAERELDARWDVYSYDVLAWALYKNRKPEEARTAMTEALKLGTKDARLFFHAGMIHRAGGDPERAREYLQRALATNPYFHLLQADVAQLTLKELGQE